MKKFLGFLPFLMLLSLVSTAQSATEYFENAMKYKQKENYTETAKLLAKALALDPQNKSIKQEMADVQYLRKAFFESIPLYEEMLQSDSKNLIILARLSEMYSMSPKKMKAVEYAELALKLNPTDGYVNKMLARTFYEVKHYPKAIAQYRIAEKALPTDLDVPFKLGFVVEISIIIQKLWLALKEPYNLIPAMEPKPMNWLTVVMMPIII
ncbi:MAG: hypothetical protein IPK62_08980 [Bacteroidetes bacterium]|nr:hypothetical protein [Bacteroidota bacterium]